MQAVVNIAAARDMMTLAEGVETSEQRESLGALGCGSCNPALTRPWPKPHGEERPLARLEP